MSQENLEIVRQMLEWWRSDTPQRGLEQMREDVAFDASVRPDGKVWRGRVAVGEALSEWSEIWDEHQLDLDDLIDAGGQHVVLLWSESGRAKHSRALLSQEGATIFTLADGLVCEIRIALDRKAVLAELGVTAKPRAE